MIQKKLTLVPETLRNFSFFASFSSEQLEEIVEKSPKISLQAHKIVFRQGEDSATMYLIFKGGVKIEREDDDGETINVGRLFEHEVFGELAMLSKEPRQATVTTLEDTELLAIDRSMMLDIIRRADPEEILEVFSVMSDQVRAATVSP